MREGKDEKTKENMGYWTASWSRTMSTQLGWSGIKPCLIGFKKKRNSFLSEGLTDKEEVSHLKVYNLSHAS